MSTLNKARSFSETLKAIDGGDEAAARELTAEIIPELVAFAIDCGSEDPETLVSQLMLDAFRKAEYFEGTKAQFVTTLLRVVAVRTENNEGADKPDDKVRAAAATEEPTLTTATAALDPLAEPELTMPTVSAAESASTTPVKPFTSQDNSEQAVQCPVPNQTDADGVERTTGNPVEAPDIHKVEPAAAKVVFAAPASAKPLDVTPPPSPSKLTIGQTHLTLATATDEQPLERSRKLFLTAGLILMIAPLLYLAVSSVQADNATDPNVALPAPLRATVDQSETQVEASAEETPTRNVEQQDVEDRPSTGTQGPDVFGPAQPQVVDKADQQRRPVTPAPAVRRDAGEEPAPQVPAAPEKPEVPQAEEPTPNVVNPPVANPPVVNPPVVNPPVVNPPVADEPAPNVTPVVDENPILSLEDLFEAIFGPA